MVIDLLAIVECVTGDGFIHKSKMNTNNTFSVGKSWKLSELKGVEVVDVSVAFLLGIGVPSN